VGVTPHDGHMGFSPSSDHAHGASQHTYSCPKGAWSIGWPVSWYIIGPVRLVTGPRWYGTKRVSYFGVENGLLCHVGSIYDLSKRVYDV
jgi:hypothetical protein